MFGENSESIFLFAWPAQPVVSLGGHFFGGLAGAIYGWSQGTLLWLVLEDIFLAAWPAQSMASLGGNIFGGLFSGTYDWPQGSHFWCPGW
jgi:hypothetical protein